MAKDIKALELLQKELSKINGMPDPPQTLDSIDEYEKKWSIQIDRTQTVFKDISDYTNAIIKQMEDIRNVLSQSTEKVQKRILEIIDSIEWTDKTTGLAPADELHLIYKLQQMEVKKNRLEESLLQTQVLLAKVKETHFLTRDDMDNLKGCIKNWVQVRDERYETEKRRKEEEKRKRREREKRERKEREEEERRRRDEEETKRQEEERKRKEEEDRKRKEEENRRREKEERRKREQEERIRKEEEERRRQEEEETKRQEEERKRKEEEDRKRKEEENRRREEEERRKREQEKRIRKEEEEKWRKEEEEERKRLEMLRIAEEERQKKEREKRQKEEDMRKERERRRKEEEERKRKLDPNNWSTISYKRNDGEVDGARQGLCCAVSAIPGSLSEEDLECLASDEVRDFDTSLGLGEKPASSVVNVASRTGKRDLEAPMRVFVPYYQTDSDDEIVIRCSIDGQEWVEKEPIYQASVSKEFKNISLVAAEINQYEKAKVIVVARTKSEDIIVDQPGLVHPSTIDKKIKFVFPRDTFRRPTKVKLQIRQILPEHLNLATQQYETCEKLLSTSPLVSVTCHSGTERDIDIDITRNPKYDKRSEKGYYHHVYRGKDKQWHFAESGMKNRNQDMTITLPRGKEFYSVLEIETRKEVSRDEVLHAAEDIYTHAHKSVVRLIAKQKADNPSTIILQCLRREQLAARLTELSQLGYSAGPDTSQEFCLSDGQTVMLKCKGNIGMRTRLSKNMVNIVFHTYMDSAKQEVTLFVVDENKQRDNDTYLGLLMFEAADNGKRSTRGELPISLPKTRQPRTRATKATIRFQPYLSALCKYLGWRLTQGDNEDWVEMLRFLGSQKEIRPIYRRAKTQHGNDDQRKICQTVIENWMKSQPMDKDKVEFVLTALSKSGNKGLAVDCKRFVNIHKVLFSDEALSALSNSTMGDLDSVATKLNLSSDMIKQCEQQVEDLQLYHAWSKWQQTDSVICKGPEASKYYIETIGTVLGSQEVVKDITLKLQKAGATFE